MRTIKIILSTVLLSLCLLACGGRTLPGADAGTAEAGPAADGTLKKDACVRPPGGCFSTKDCPAGQQCKGCGADPCCPMCAVCYGKCVPAGPGGCATNVDCAYSEYCHLDSGCKATGAKMGACKPRPKGCDLLYAPVCGCDGKTHGNECAAHAAGTNIAYQGPCQTCAQLSTAFSKAVQDAKACNPYINSLQCQIKTKNSLGCPCLTFIEKANAAAIKSMNEAQSKWTAQGCAEWDCGRSCGPEPKSAICQMTSVGTQGICQDKK